MKHNLFKLIAGKKGSGILALAILMAGLAPGAHAVGLLIPNQDAMAIGRGNAFAATADNPSAIYYNQAGITQLPGTELEVGDLNYFGLNLTYKPANGSASEHTAFRVLPVPHIYATKTLEKIPLSFGVGVYAPFGLGVQWPEGSATRDFALSSKLTYLTVNPVIAYKILPSLSIAAGPTLNYGQLTLTRGLASPTDYFRFCGDDFSYGATAGILWQPLEKWSFGASYRSASSMDFGGHTSYAPFGQGTQPSFYAPTKAHVPFPEIFSGGISYRPTPKWNVEVDVDYINWDKVNDLKLQGSGAIFFNDLDLQLNWQDSFQYKVGVTRYFDNGWYVSAGYYYTSETTSSQYFTPGVPDTELHVPSIGFGRDGEHWHFAVAGQFIFGPPRSITSSPNAPSGSYQLISPTLTVSVGYKF